MMHPSFLQVPVVFDMLRDARSQHGLRNCRLPPSQSDVRQLRSPPACGCGSNMMNSRLTWQARRIVPCRYDQQAAKKATLPNTNGPPCGCPVNALINESGVPRKSQGTRLSSASISLPPCQRCSLPGQSPSNDCRWSDRDCHPS